MPNKRYKAEQIVTLPRQIEVGIANGKTTRQACEEVEITEQTYYRWQKEYGGVNQLFGNYTGVTPSQEMMFRSLV
jgi:transposase